MVSTFTRAGLGALLIASALVWPSAGLADDPVAVTRAPDVQGKFVVGQTLHAVHGEWTGPADTSWGLTWLRCADAQQDPEDCSTILGVTGDTYTLTDADAGKVMRAYLWAAFGDDSARKASGPSDVVKAADGTVPQPSTPGSFDIVAAASKPGPAIPGLKRITPKPVVRIRGRYTSTGATITLFTVKAPKSATTKLVCKGTCPAKTQTIKGGKTTHVKKFERALKAGTKLTLTTTRKGYVSEVTVLTIRRKAAPTRSDSCILPGKKSSQRCPA